MAKYYTQSQTHTHTHKSTDNLHQNSIRLSGFLFSRWVRHVWSDDVGLEWMYFWKTNSTECTRIYMYIYGTYTIYGIYTLYPVNLSCCLFSHHFFSLSVQVSFFSTSPELSNKQRFEYFTRTIPSDHHQVKAMVEIVRRMGWSYISIIYEESNYGIKVGYACIMLYLLMLHIEWNQPLSSLSANIFVAHVHASSIPQIRYRTS